MRCELAGAVLVVALAGCDLQLQLGQDGPWASLPSDDPLTTPPRDPGPRPSDWDLGEMVHWIAANPDLARGGMGESGRPSEGSLTAPKIAAIAAPTTLVFLLSNDSPGVRAWIADALVKSDPELADATYPLLLDGDGHWASEGCSGYWLTVGAFVLESLCRTASAPAVADVLLRAASEDALGEARGKALVCVAPHRKPEARALARAMLHDPDEKLVAAGAHAAGLAGDEDSLPELTRLAQSSTFGLWYAAIAGLSALDGPGVLPVLERLLDDPAKRHDAAEAYTGRAGAKPDVIERLLKDDSEAVRSYAASGIINARGNENLPVLLRTPPTTSFELGRLAARPPTPALTAFFRALARKTDNVEVRKVARGYLARAGLGD